MIGPAPQEHVYRLELSDPERRFDQRPLYGILQVTRLRADALTGERPLLYRQNSVSPQLSRHPYRRWVDPPMFIPQQEIAT